MDSDRQVRTVREGSHVLIECGQCGPVAVLTDPTGASEVVHVLAHIASHRTSATIVVQE